MHFWPKTPVIVTLAILSCLAATPSDSLGDIVVTNRNSNAIAVARVCDNPDVRSSRTDSLPFTATHENEHRCVDGIANASIQYSDSLSFSGFGLSGVFAEGSAYSSATHLNEDNHFDVTTGSGQGNMTLTFQVVGQPAQFVFEGWADIYAAGSTAAAEAEFSIFGQDVEYISRAFVTGDSSAAPIEWQEAGDLQPGYYSISIDVRAACAPDWRTTDVFNQAGASLRGTITFTQFFGGIVVNSTGDAPDNNPGDAMCDTGGPYVDGQPECTLRAAIMETNATLGLRSITFEIPFTDPNYETITRAFRIKPQPPSALPEITQSVVIDATTQAGTAAAATAGMVTPSAVGFGPRPTVILDGADLETGSDEYHGLNISGGDCEVRGLAIIKFNGHGIYLHGNGDNKVHGNFIGIAPGATSSVPDGNNRDGVRIEGVADNVVGGFPDADRNVISNNGLIGTAAVNVHIMNSTAKNNDIIGNYIGTDDTGLSAFNNTTGVFINGAPQNTVEGNVISGNQAGVRIVGEASQENRIVGNLIGTDADGWLALPNREYGVAIEAASFNTIGGPTATPGTTPGNVISGNRSDGRAADGIRILASESRHNKILGNLIGTDGNGRLARGNGGAGVFIELADSNEVGGPNVEDANVIADNDSGGVVIKSSGNRILGNFIGTDIDGDLALGNKRYGIRIHDESDNTIQGNLVSGNQVGGVLIEGDDATKNQVAGNAIGTKSERMEALGNLGPGVSLEGSHENRLEDNLISGNQGSGMALSDSASQNLILNNRIGTKENGEEPLPNTEDGIHIHDSPSNRLESNTVSGNAFAGIHIQGEKARSNTLIHNYLGLSADGLKPLGNGEDGAFLDNAPNNTVEYNHMSANGRYGVFVLGGASGSKIDGNTIGMNLGESLALGNMADGIRAQLAERTQIYDNLIVASGFNGICIQNDGTATQDTLWGNVIAANEQSGILVSGGTQNLIRKNSIFQNDLLGIDLEPLGLTPNDEGDWDNGPNNLQNFPTLQFAFEDTLSGTTTLIGFLESTPSTTFDVDVYENASCDDSGYGEGETYFRTFNVTTGTSGVVHFAEVFPDLLTNKLITTTATDDMGNTSEFSKCVEIDDSGGVVIVNSEGDTGDRNPGDGSCYTGDTNSESEPECTLRAAIQEINAQSGSQIVIFDIPGEAPHTISPASELPAVVGQAVLDATTQQGFSGSPVVEIDGSGGTGIDGLTLSGGGVTVRGFVINRFDGNGILIGGSGSHVLELNYVGTDVAGSQDRGNEGHGVLVTEGDNNRIGSLDADMANVIAFNDSNGVRVAAGRGNSIHGNSIHANGRLGIDLQGGSETAEGVTSNDEGDGDTGPNELQNYPALDRAVVNGDELEVQGSLSGVPEATYRIEVFGNSDCDSSAFGEGRTYLGSYELALVGGDPTFDVVLPLDGQSAGSFITATATDAGNNTSEFSACVEVELTPFVVSLGILQNPFLSQFLDLYMVASTEVDPQSLALTVGGENVPMMLTDPAENLWKGDYELDGSGTIPIEVCAAGMTGIADCDSTSVVALLAMEGTPVDLRSADGRFDVRVPGSDIIADGFVVIIPSTGSVLSPAPTKDGLPVVVGASKDASDILSSHTVSGSNLDESSSITVEYRFKDLPLTRGTELSQLYIHHLGVGNLPSFVDLSAGVVRATTDRLGTYELCVGPVGSNRIADAAFLRLDPNYPNPFNPSTLIQYELQTRQHVRLTIYDPSGRRVARLVDEIVPAGAHRILWNAKSGSGEDVASGVYAMRLETAHSEVTRKMVLVR